MLNKKPDEGVFCMQKAAALFFLLLLLMGLPFLLAAQEDSEGENPEVEPDWDIYTTDMYARGDQTFIISLGMPFPVVFLNNGKEIKHNITPPLGGTGSLSYNYFLGPNIYLGGEVGGVFFPTLGGNVLYIIPLGFRAGYQFYLWRLEFPVNLTLGMAWHRYLNLGYYGFYMKGGAAAYYRFNSEWSFGLTGNWGWFPQWVKNEPHKNVDGNFLEFTLSARYHF